MLTDAESVDGGVADARAGLRRVRHDDELARMVEDRVEALRDDEVEVQEEDVAIEITQRFVEEGDLAPPAIVVWRGDVDRGAVTRLDLLADARWVVGHADEAEVARGVASDHAEEAVDVLGPVSVAPFHADDLLACGCFWRGVVVGVVHGADRRGGGASMVDSGAVSVDRRAVFEGGSSWGACRPGAVARSLRSWARPLVRKGATRPIGRLLQRLFRLTHGRVVDTELWGFRLRLVDDGNLSEKRALFTEHRLDPGERLFLKTHIHPGDVFLDVGANAGLYSYWVASLGCGARILAFEPHPALAAQCRFNFETNGIVGAALYACALGEEAGEATLSVEGGEHREGGGRWVVGRGRARGGAASFGRAVGGERRGGAMHEDRHRGARGGRACASCSATRRHGCGPIS